MSAQIQDRTQEVLNDYSNYCKVHAAQHIKTLTPDKIILKFTGTYLQHPTPFITFADFKSLIVSIHTLEPSPHTSYAVPKQKHVPCDYAYLIVNQKGNH